MISLINQLKFASGQKAGQENTIIFPLLQHHGLTHAISVGPAAKNMAQAYNFSHDDLIKRQDEYLSQNGLNALSYSYISHVPKPHEPVIQEITDPNQTGEVILTPAEGLFTTLRNTPLIHKPADCPTAIILAQNTKERALGIVHLGRPQVNKQVTEKIIDHLVQNYTVKPEDIIVGITPSIGPKHYYLKLKDQEKKQLIDQKYWGRFAWKDKLDGETIVRIDILGKILSILDDKGIPDKNIEAYGHGSNVDTFDLAAHHPPLSFSHRFATFTNQPQRNGRIMVVAQL